MINELFADQLEDSAWALGQPFDPVSSAMMRRMLREGGPENGSGAVESDRCRARLILMRAVIYARAAFQTGVQAAPGITGETFFRARGQYATHGVPPRGRW
jgi:hypothetical protein